MRILGIDPGSRITGYGVIETTPKGLVYLDSGCIRVKGEALSERLLYILQGIDILMERFQPHEGAIESVFVNKSVDSALKLGQARGVAIVAMAKAKIRVDEYSPTYVKKAVVGTGTAEKSQVQHMVKLLLNLSGDPQADAADALAIAICHAQHLQVRQLRSFA